MNEIKLIVPVSRLKDGMVCYKITGEKRYVVRRKIFVGDTAIEADKSSVFLLADIGGSNYIKAYSSDTEVRYQCNSISEVEELFPEERDCK
jgi:hypothetical protein